MRQSTVWLVSVALGAIVAAAAPVLAERADHGGGFAHAMPERGFHGAPPDYHGGYPHEGHSAAGPRGGAHPAGAFHGHAYAQFSPAERHAWQGGAWRHEWHNGHLGWWWFVDGAWFFYPQPIYPYPAYVGPDAYYDYYDNYGPPEHYWYYCEDPQGYYPYVQHCRVPWQPVPPAPPDQ